MLDPHRPPPAPAQCGWNDFADSFYSGARVYQLALTEELLGRSADGGPLRFTGGGAIRPEHTRAGGGVAALRSGIPQPSTWPYGGDAIPIVDGRGGYLLPLVLADGATLDPGTLHAYQLSAGPQPDPDCPLYQVGGRGAGRLRACAF